MRDNHIVTMLDAKPVGQLTEDELSVIKAHAALCPACLRAFEAARASDSLIRARAGQVIDVSPFFKTRVMAAIRERELQPELPALARMWKAAGALVSMMAALVVVLVGLTIFSYSPDLQMQGTEIATSQNIYSPEYVVLERGDLEDDPIAYDQVLGTIYDAEDEDGN